MDNIQERIRYLRELAELSKSAVAAALEKSAAAYGKKETGKTAFSLNDVDVLCTFFKARKEWVIDGKGEMYEKPLTSNEQEVSYEGMRWSRVAVRTRFKEIWVRDKAINKVDSDMAQSKRWHMNYTHVKDVMSGTKDVTVSMLTAACRYGKANLNYIMGGYGEMDLYAKAAIEHPAQQKKRA